MIKKYLNSAETPAEQLLNIRDALVSYIWKGVVVLAIFGTPASVSRSLATGWLPLYTFHISLAAIVVSIFVFREKLSFSVRASVLLAIFFMIGVVGIFTLGILGAGLWWLVISIFLVSTLYSLKAGIVAATSSLFLFFISGYGFVNGILVMPVDANEYVTQTSSWITFLFGASVMPVIVFLAIAMFQRATASLLEEVHRQRMEMERMATHDQLTGLLLLNMAQDRLQMALNSAHRSGRKVALLFIDLDGFKTINDTFGHEAGDHVLVEVSKRLVAILRDEDTAARIGGDEFILILGNLNDSEVISQIAQRVISEISEPINFSGKSLLVGASIGIGLYPDHADNAEALRRVADEAMYVVKKSGKNRFGFAQKCRDDGSNNTSKPDGLQPQH
ncbi:MAG: GGDEF domain-containing protein [Rhodocyclaceae bacterium]|nr:GGDEF domain-containing protein [Rhodocyclaceae bacterium]